MILKVKTDAGTYSVKVKNTADAARFLRDMAQQGYKCLKWEVC